MSNTTTQAPSTKVVTGLVRLSYFHGWEPVALEEGQDKKYSTSIIIPKSDTDTIAKIEKAIEAAKLAGKEKLGAKGGKLKLPLRDGDEERPDDEAYANSYFLNASSRRTPGIVDKNVSPIMDQDEVQSGDYARVSINFYAYNTSGNRGIAVGLNNIMKVKTGERLGGKSSAADDFAAVAADSDDDLF